MASDFFVGFVIELLSIIISIVVKDKHWIAIVIFLVGTLISAIIAIPPLLSKDNHNLPQEITPTQDILPNSSSDNISMIDNKNPVSEGPQKATVRIDTWNNILSVRMPTLNEIRNERPVSLWDFNLIDVGDLETPSFANYQGTAKFGQEYLLPVYWCALSDELLQKDIENIQTEFSVNGEKIPDQYIFNYHYDIKTGWKCDYHAVILGDWVINANYDIEVKRTFLTDINDGQITYPAGEYIYRININIK